MIEKLDPLESGSWSRRTFLTRLGGQVAAGSLIAMNLPSVTGTATEQPAPVPAAGLRGPMIFVATPMTARNGRAIVDYDGMRRNIAFYAAQRGPSCLCICGGTGEFNDLTAGEVLQATHAAAEVKGRSFLVVGVGGADTKEAVARTKALQGAGADALLAMPTEATRAGDQQVTYQHLAALCRASEIGILPYQAAYQPLEMETILRLTELDTFVALKSAGKTAEWYQELYQRTGRSLPIFPGSDFGAPYWHLAGCAGFTTGLAGLVPQTCIGLWELLERGEYRKGVAEANRLRPLAEFRREHGTAMLKAGMEILGYAGGPVRAGVKVLNQAQRAALRQLLEPFSGSTLNS